MNFSACLTGSWRERRRWIKVHVAMDAKNGKMLSFEVTDERTADLKVFEDLVGNLKLKGCLADGAYDSKEILELFEKKGVDSPPYQATQGCESEAFAQRQS